MLILKKLKLKNKLLFLFVLLKFSIFLNFLPALELEGNFIQGGLVLGKINKESKIYLDEKKIPKDNEGAFLIAFDRNFKSSANLKVITPDNKNILKTIRIKQRKYKVQSITIKDQNKVTPKKSFYDRINSEYKLVKRSKSIFYESHYYRKGFIMPAKGIITGVYGSQRIFNGIPKRPHYGIDIANKIGTKIIAPSDGIVVLAQKDLFFSGGTIIISHGRGLSSSFLHLSEILVKEGQKIKQGKVIGKMGQSGRATGSHLDWRMELRGVRIDPELLVNK